MTDLRLVGGTDVGDVARPAIWDDPHGAERVIRDLLHQDQLVAVTIVGINREGNVVVVSNHELVETAIGLLERGKDHIIQIAAEAAMERALNESDPA